MSDDRAPRWETKRYGTLRKVALSLVILVLIAAHANALVIIAQDGQYLGKATTSTLDSDSFLNPYSPYGSKYSQTSIWNKYGTYGSAYGDYSAFSKYATKPPMLLDGAGMVAYITTNKHIKGGISPYGLVALLHELGL